MNEGSAAAEGVRLQIDVVDGVGAVVAFTNGRLGWPPPSFLRCRRPLWHAAARTAIRRCSQ
ncbi:MAG: hypothetical protein H6668_10385 [Ardenticatenaceae bacterium]|nr:hypothetical protein [Ardenticatenaceae bacterium]